MTFPGMKDAGNAPICSRFSRMRSLLNFTDRRFWRQVFGHSVSHPADGCSDFASDLCVSADSALLPLNVLTSNLRIRRSNPYRPHGLESYIDCGASVAQLPVGKRAATRGPARVSQGRDPIRTCSRGLSGTLCKALAKKISTGFGLRRALSDLDRRARHRAVGTEHAAIPWLRLEALPATLADIKESAGVFRHPPGRLMRASRARDGGLRDHLSLAAASSWDSRAACARAQRSQER